MTSIVVVVLFCAFIAWGLGSGGQAIYRRNARKAQAAESIWLHSHDRGDGQ